jgi:hypothetical protein
MKVEPAAVAELDKLFAWRGIARCEIEASHKVGFHLVALPKMSQKIGRMVALLCAGRRPNMKCET